MANKVTVLAEKLRTHTDDAVDCLKIFASEYPKTKDEIPFADKDAAYIAHELPELATQERLLAAAIADDPTEWEFLEEDADVVASDLRRHAKDYLTVAEALLLAAWIGFDKLKENDR